MGTRYRRTWSRFGITLPCGSVGLVVAALIALGVAAPAFAQQPKRVLLLFDEDRALPALAVLERSLRDGLATSFTGDVAFIAESLNLSQFNDEHYERVLFEYYAGKYAGKHIDAVVAVMGPSLKFLLRYGDALFPGVPIVFCGTDAVEIQGIALPPRVTGTLMKRTFAPTVELALRLQPDVRRVYVVGGTSPADRYVQASARDALRAFAGRVAVEFIVDKSLGDLLATVSHLPPGSAILYTSVFRDAAGQAFIPHEVLSQVAAAATAPVYILVDQYLGRGAIGGYLFDVGRHGRAAAAITARVLRGEQPSGIPVSSTMAGAAMFDARQLSRWSVDERLLPAESIVRFREPTTWRRYRPYIAGAAALMVVQTGLIVALLVARKRRDLAERRLRGSFERIRELGGRLLHAQETERAHIARELHDDISQQLALLKIDLESLGRNLDGPHAGALHAGVRRTDEIVASVHALSHRLHPAKLRLIGLVPALEGLRSELSRPGTMITFTHDVVPAALSLELTVCVYRIAQEALHNALRHADARNVSIHLGDAADALVLTVIDDGAGFDVATSRSTGIGLTSMRERVEMLGGSFEIRSAPGCGTRLVITVPVSPVEQPDVDADADADAVAV